MNNYLLKMSKNYFYFNIKSFKLQKSTTKQVTNILLMVYSKEFKFYTFFFQAIKTNKLSGPVILSRDHHDVSGTDSPYRETSNVYDGSAFCAGTFNSAIVIAGYKNKTTNKNRIIISLN